MFGNILERKTKKIYNIRLINHNNNILGGGVLVKNGEIPQRIDKYWLSRMTLKLKRGYKIEMLEREGDMLQRRNSQNYDYCNIFTLINL